MEPLSVLGALASSSQLCEMALKYSYRAYNFISAVKHSEEHVELLQQGLQETNVLVRILQLYIERLRSNPPSDHYLPALYSIREISEQFASDMICLHELLPYDMASFSASVRKRTQFVLKKKDTENILRRLEDRKRSATLALEIIGRFNDLGAQQDLLSLRSQLQQLTTEQNAIHSSTIEQHNESVAQSRMHEAHIQAAIQDLQNLVAQHGNESTHHHNALSEDVARNFSEIKTQLTEISTRQDLIMASQRVQIATTQIEATDSSVLARLIRHELQQQLKPLHDQIGREHIDRVVDAFFAKIIETRPFEDDPMLQTKSKDSRASHRSDFDQLSGESVLEKKRSTSPSNKPASIRPRQVIFFSTSRYIYTKFGVLIFRIKKYRQCMSGTPSYHVYFKLAVEIIPQPRISSRGLSAIYSSGPDLDGYRSIFPNISVINTFTHGSEVHHLLIKDDLKGFRLLLERGVVGIWDKFEGGWNLLEMAMSAKSPFISQYLLCQSGYGAQLVERGSDVFTGCWDVFAASSMNADLEVLADILVHLKRIESQLVEEPAQPQLGVSYSLRWLFKTSKTAETITSSQARSTRISSIRLLGEFGRVIHPFDMGRDKVLMKNIVFMDIYLAAGGNPNTPTRHGVHPLVAALAIIYGHLGRHADEHAELYDDGSDDEARGGYDIANRDHAVMLLIMLITAGADVHYFDESLAKCCYTTLSDLAIELDITDIWLLALSACGLDPIEVYVESERRLDQHLKLHGASRTGVDVEPIVNQQSISGVRRRNGTVYAEV